MTDEQIIAAFAETVSFWREGGFGGAAIIDETQAVAIGREIIAALPGWRSMDSAPKDGTPIIIGLIDDGQLFDVCHGYFEVVPEDEDDGPWDMRDGEPWCSYVGREAGTYFCNWAPGGEFDSHWRVTEPFEYTHWLPAPPSTQAP